MPPESPTGPFSEKLSPFSVTWSQAEFELDFYRRILQRAPQNVDVLRLAAELLSGEGLHREALELDTRLAELEPQDGMIRYNFACSLALASQVELAIAELDAALTLGYDDFAHLEADPDLACLRHLPAYQDLLDRELP
jgi:tetratricopeptide (TPR) repeat protein